jgi:Peptidase A4 family
VISTRRRPDRPARRPRGGSVVARFASVALLALIALGACDTSPAPSGPVATPDASATDAGVAIASATPIPTTTVRPTPTPSTPRPTPTPRPSASGPSPCPGKAASGYSGPARSESSTNWSGYAATASHSTISCVEASWTQPTVHCGSVRQAVSIWIGIGGFDQDGLEQIGTEADCVGGEAVGSMWHESLPSQHFEVPIHMTIRPGDKVRARVRMLSTTVYELSIANLTRRTSFTIRDTNKRIVATSAEWIVEAPTGGCPGRCRVLPMPNFGKFRFSGTAVTASGIREPLDGADFSHVAIRMVSAGGNTRASVSSTAADGSSFVVTWRRQ